MHQPRPHACIPTPLFLLTCTCNVMSSQDIFVNFGFFLLPLSFHQPLYLPSTPPPCIYLLHPSHQPPTSPHACISIPFTDTSRFQHSFIPNTVPLWNNLPLESLSCTTLTCLSTTPHHFSHGCLFQLPVKRCTVATQLSVDAGILFTSFSSLVTFIA